MPTSGYLLDTSAFLQATGASATLSKKARTVLENTANLCYVPVVVAWELTLLVNRGRIQLPMSALRYVKSRAALLNTPIIDLTLEDVGEIASIAQQCPDHRDPFDHAILAIAKNRSLTVISSDRAFRQYKLPIINSKA